jgi:DNA-directed RNA polymerase sigma subunit (sigma70/sigma32)
MSKEMLPDELALAFAKGVGRAREKAGQMLLARYDKVIEAILRDEAARAGVHVANDEQRGEIRDELRICLFEAAASFDPEKSLAKDGNGFEHWVRYCIQNRLAALAGEEHAVAMPESWQKIARISSKVDEKLTQKLKRSPTRDELRAGVVEYSIAWAKERLIEAGSRLEGEKLETAAMEKLRKQGTWGAIEHLDDIHALRGSMEAYDTEIEVSYPEENQNFVDGVFAMLNEEERFIIEHRMGMVDGNEWTFEEIAQELGKPWPEVRKSMATALSKPKAPHAQYVYLAGIGAQVEQDRAGSAIGRMRTRASA